MRLCPQPLMYDIRVIKFLIRLVYSTLTYISGLGNTFFGTTAAVEK